VVILRGKIQWVFYDDSGRETDRVTLDANGPLRMLNVERDRWHSLVCLESGSVLFESKDGGYVPLREGDVME
jgi:cupin fold WbuC family metalloprotein